MVCPFVPSPVFRFAPSPNGALHLGHAYSALLNHALAEQTGGAFLIRVEDIDTTRCTPALEQAMFDDLAWLGLSWKTPVLRQSERFAVYQAALQHLEEMDLVYPAFLSRAEIKAYAKNHPFWPHDPDGVPHYPGVEKTWNVARRGNAIREGAPFAWRLDMEKALAAFPVAGAAKWGDVILARKDTPTSYHLAVVLDDAAQNVTHVVRGRDLEAATPMHQLLQKLLSLPTPRYFHHRLICDRNGAKLSKSNHATGLRHLRDHGAALDDIKRLIDWNAGEIAVVGAQWM